MMVEVHGHMEPNGAFEQEVVDCPEGYGAAKFRRSYETSLGLYLLIGSDCELRNELREVGVVCRLSCGLRPK
jgi:hypothetical protein